MAVSQWSETIQFKGSELSHEITGHDEEIAKGFRTLASFRDLFEWAPNTGTCRRLLDIIRKLTFLRARVLG